MENGYDSTESKTYVYDEVDDPDVYDEAYRDYLEEYDPSPVTSTSRNKKYRDSPETNIEVVNDEYLRDQRRTVVRQLDIDLIHPNVDNFNNEQQGGSKVIFVGKPKSGKSVAVKSLMYEKSDIIPVCQIVSGSEEMNKHYEKFVPRSFIHYEFNRDSWAQAIERQKTAIKYRIENPWACFVWDDISYNKGRKDGINSDLVDMTYKNGRHFKMLHIFAMQYAIDLTQSIRTAVDGSFLFLEKNRNSRQKLFENYGGPIESQSDFDKIMSVVCKDYRCIYINNIDSTAEDCVYWYKAHPDVLDPNLKWSFGCQEMWMFDNERAKRWQFQ